jgi:hypothetical protein
MPRHLHVIAAAGLAGFALLVLGCNDPRRATGPRSVASRIMGHSMHIDRPPEDDVAQHGKNIPGFGGYTFRSGGNMVVFLTDLSYSARVRAELASFLATGPRRVRHGWLGHPASAAQSGSATIEIRKANYTFEQLRNWRDQVDEPLLATRGVVMLGVDIKKNVIFVGVDQSAYETGRLSVERVLDVAAVPRGAVRIDRSSALREQVGLSRASVASTDSSSCSTFGGHTNRDSRRPLIAGLMICWADSSNRSRECTLGFITAYQGDPAFVTAAHCSKIQGGLDSTVYGQPDASAPADEVGYEVLDPAFALDSGCDSACRWSDANIVKLDSVSGVLGRMARPVVCGLPYTCPDTWSFIEGASPYDYFTIESEGPGVDSGEVWMLGARSGETYGWVQQQCIDAHTENHGVLHCQAAADYWSEKGDSGAPIFFWPDTPPYDQYVDLLGIHDGNFSNDSLGCPDHGCGVYSQIRSIKRDLGSIPTH